MHASTTTNIGGSIGVTSAGLILEILGFCYFVNYKGIADYTHRDYTANWKSAPGRRYFAPRLAGTPVRRTRIFMGSLFTVFGTIFLALGIYSLVAGLR